MDIRFTHICVVEDFVNDDLDTIFIYDSLLPYIKNILLANDFKIPDDWILIYSAGYTNGRTPLVSKNRIGSYPSDKMKYITIIIPVPLESEIRWGVKSEQHLYRKDHYDKLMKNFWELDVDYRNYNNRTDYITACLEAGIKKSFEEGFTVGGVKIKTKNTFEM
ncbi:MAG: hypothetical protein IPL23_09995 [Saprospiraceae bacterium]|nr:hypothetical protein [Saprospiraceae bacterium]